jgi:hypothetical protein
MKRTVHILVSIIFPVVLAFFMAIDIGVNCWRRMRAHMEKR